MSFFDDAGAWFDQAGKDTDEWFDQAGKDIDQGVQDFGEVHQDVAQVVGEAIPDVGQQVVGDVAQVINYVFNSDSPNPNSVIDQIETNADQQPTSGSVVDQIESTIVQPPTSDYVVDQIESQFGQQSTSDYVVGPDFNKPAPELSSPGFKTFDPLTNPNPGLESSAFEFSEVGLDALSIDGTYGADFTRIEDLLGLVAGGGYDSIASMDESLLDTLNSIYEVADVPMF